MTAKEKATRTRARRDDAILAYLRDVTQPYYSGGILQHGEFVAADTVARAFPDISSVGVGRILSRLASEGRVDVQHNGYMGFYRHPDWNIE